MRLPQPFGKYLLLERISVGGMAEVFKAKAFGVEGFEKIIAIKKILPSMAEDADFIQMFIDEAKICGQLNHANICQIFELGRIDDSHFIAMEYIWGKDVLQIQNRFRRLRKFMPVNMAAFLASKMCEGLDYAHRKKDATGKPLNIIHRDVSPQNVIVSYEGEVKVIDFGIAKAASRSSKTQAGVLKGKFGYMSPEQVGGKPLDQKADIFAIGTILYEILTNERLFLGESDFATLEKVRNVNVPPPSTVNKEIPPALDKIIMKALAKDLEARYQWGSDMHDDLQDFLVQTEPVYNAKSLATWMREQFSVEMKKEAAVLDEQRKIGREAMNAVQAPKSALPPSARLKSPTMAPISSAPKAAPATSAPVADPHASEPEDGGTLVEDSPEIVDPNEALLNEKTSIVQTDHQPEDLPAQSTQILGGPPGEDGKEPGDLAALSTVVFNADAHSGGQAPAAPAAAPQPMQVADPMMSAVGPGGYPQPGMQMQPGQNMSMVGPMGAFPNPYGQPGMQGMPYGTGAFSAMPATGHTGMMMLPNGAIVPGMMPVQQQQQPAPPARSSALWKDILVGVLVAIGVVGMVLGLKFFLAPGKGTIVLTVSPQRVAAVFVDGQERGRIEPGTAFLLKDLVKGQHLIMVRADEGEAQQVVEVGAGEMMPLAVQLSASNTGGAAPSTNQGSGVLRLRLPADGALVSINGRLINEKDIIKGYLVPAGVAQEVTVKKAGKRPESFSVTLEPGQEYDRAVELREGRGRLIINTRPAGAEVQVNGRSYGKSPVNVEDLDPIKAVKIVIKKRGFATINRLHSFGDTFDQTLDIDLAGGGKDEERSSSSSSSSPSSAPASSPPPASAAASSGDKEGYLIANSRPYAKVIIDGKDSGKVTPIAPRDRIPLKPGKHVVTFLTSDKRASFDVVVKAGEEVKLVRNLDE